VNAMSTISTKSGMHFMVFTETFDADDVMCRFLDRLASHFDRKVHLVVDGPPPTTPARSAPGSPITPTLSSCTSCRRTRRS
jgi:hypothetical protein